MSASVKRTMKWSMLFAAALVAALGTAVLAQVRQVDQGKAGTTTAQVWLVKICDSAGANCGTVAIPVTITGTLPVTGTVQSNAGTGTVNVTCISGCGGAATFSDAAAFSFGSTPIGNIGAVVDDVATNTVAENSAAIPRMSTNRILFIDFKNTQTNTNALTVTGTQQISGGTLTGVTGTFTANAGTGTMNDTFTNTAIQANQGTPANTTAPWFIAPGSPTSTTTALTSAGVVDTTIGLPVTNYPAVAVTLNPSGTVTTGTFIFEVSDDGGTTWYPILGVRQDSAQSPSASINASCPKCTIAFPVSGFTNFRARLNPVITGTGTANIRLMASAASRDPYSALLNTVPVSISQVLGAALTTANGVIIGARTSTDNAPAVTTEGQSRSPMLDKHGRVVIQYAPLDAQTNTTVDLTGTASVQALAATANVKWAVYDWCVSLIGTSAGTLATTVHLLDGTTTRDSITFAQTATTAGEPRDRCHSFQIPIQATTSAAVNVQATATAATTTIRTVVGAAKTGT